ncbi:MAG: ABC transporter permease [Candidatus Heimdallarchaeota archaeon]|nr:ABC transporter permease [Candidatus Heimdallarchaeota archaeon]
MSLQLATIKTEGRRDAITMVLLTFSFSIIAMLIVLILLAIAGYTFDTGELFNLAFTDVLNDKNNRAWILFWAGPLILSGLAVSLAFHVGLFNIGVQGQMILGGSFAGIWAVVLAPDLLETNLLTNAFFMVLSTMVAGILGGAMWGFVPGLLKAKAGAHEVIVTILMNLIAISLARYWFSSQRYSPFIDKSRGDTYNQTGPIQESAKIPKIGDSIPAFLSFTRLDLLVNWSILDWSLAIVLVMVLVFQILIFRTKFGFKLRATGFSQTASKTVGIRPDRLIISAMTLSGALGGLAGALISQSVQYRYVVNQEGSVGFDGIAVALIGQNAPFGIAIAAIFFGFLKQSKVNLKAESSIPADLISSLQAFIVLFAAAPLLARAALRRYKRLRYSEELKERSDVVDEPAKQEVGEENPTTTQLKEDER